MDLLQSSSNEIKNKKFDYLYTRPEKGYVVLPYDVVVLSVYSLYPTLSKNIVPIFGDSTYQGEGAFYDVFEDGTVDIPLLGKIHVAGQTVKRIEKIILSKLSKFFDPEKLHVRVTLGGSVNFVGEVNTVIKILNRPLSLIEAVAMIGGLPLTCDRRKIEIIRQYPEGVKSYYVDITDARVMESKYYWLKPNDIVNLHPLPQKFWGVGVTGYSIFSTFATTLTTVTSLFFTYYAVKDRL